VLDAWGLNLLMFVQSDTKIACLKFQISYSKRKIITPYMVYKMLEIFASGK